MQRFNTAFAADLPMRASALDDQVQQLSMISAKIVV